MKRPCAHPAAVTVKLLLKTFARKILSRAGYTVTRTRQHSPLPVPGFARLWQKLNHAQRIVVAPYLPYSASQIAQDLFVLLESQRRTIAPFFVEFGATDGRYLSNTILLEQQLGWTGILAEPARIYHDALRANRNCRIDLRCVAEQTGASVEFSQAADATLSTMTKFVNNGDWASQTRSDDTIRYQVDTISLCDLLEQHDAPRRIGYLSIDTEGSELSILQAFDFSRYSFDVITVEHAWRPGYRGALHKLLTAHGYQRVFENISIFDSWYVRPE